MPARVICKRIQHLGGHCHGFHVLRASTFMPSLVAAACLQVVQPATFQYLGAVSLFEGRLRVGIARCEEYAGQHYNPRVVASDSGN